MGNCRCWPQSYIQSEIAPDIRYFEPRESAYQTVLAPSNSRKNMKLQPEYSFQIQPFINTTSNDRSSHIMQPNTTVNNSKIKLSSNQQPHQYNNSRQTENTRSVIKPTASKLRANLSYSIIKLNPTQSVSQIYLNEIRQQSSKSSIYKINKSNSNRSVFSSLRGSSQSRQLFKSQLKQKINKITAITDSNQRIQNQLQLANEAVSNNCNEQAMQLFAAVVNQLSKLSVKTDKTLDTQAYAYFSLINLMIITDKDQNQIQLYCKLTQQIYNRHPNIYIEQLISLKSNLAFMKQKHGKYEQSVKRYEEVLKLQQTYLHKKDQRTTTTRNNIACIYYKNGKIVEGNIIINKAMTDLDVNSEMYKVLQANYQNYNQHPNIMKSQFKSGNNFKQPNNFISTIR